jgi:hypothetical protein
MAGWGNATEVPPLVQPGAANVLRKTIVVNASVWKRDLVDIIPPLLYLRLSQQGYEIKGFLDVRTISRKQVRDGKDTDYRERIRIQSTDSEP